MTDNVNDGKRNFLKTTMLGAASGAVGEAVGAARDRHPACGRGVRGGPTLGGPATADRRPAATRTDSRTGTTAGRDTV